MPDDDAPTSLEVPHPTAVDRIRDVAIGAAGAIPLAGSMVGVLVGMVWASAYQTNVEKFLAELDNGLSKLRAQVDDLDERLGHEPTATVGIAATRAAGATNDDRKRTNLANAVLNVAENAEWDGKLDLALILIRLIDELTPTHTRLLDLLTDPEGWQRRRQLAVGMAPNSEGRYSIRDLIAQTLPDIAALDTTVYAALADLESRQLLSGVGIAEPEAGRQSWSSLREIGTPLGVELLAFIAR